MTETLALVSSRIDTYRQPVVYMHEDCHVCRSEGFAAQTRIRIDLKDRWIIATLNVVRRGAWLAVDQAALSVSAWAALGAEIGDDAARKPMARGWTGPGSRRSCATRSTAGYRISTLPPS